MLFGFFCWFLWFCGFYDPGMTQGMNPPLQTYTRETHLFDQKDTYSKWLRNPFHTTVQKSCNDSTPVNTNQQWFMPTRFLGFLEFVHGNQPRFTRKTLFLLRILPARRPSACSRLLPSRMALMAACKLCRVAVSSLSRNSLSWPQETHLSIRKNSSR